MRIDSTHRNWMTATVVLLAVAAFAYFLFARSFPGGARGGTAAGISYGVGGYALMLYAALLGLRKKVPVWRLGRAQTWMRGHLWLGFLSYPLIVFHSGFAANGPLTRVLMILITIVFLTGLVGAALQHFIPKMILSVVPLETVYEEIPHVRKQICEEADRLVMPLALQAAAPRALPAEVRHIEAIKRESPAYQHFLDIYRNTIRPFLRSPEQIANECSEPTRCAAFFSSLRSYLPPAVHPILADLEHICEEQRQLRMQRRLYLWLHGWLLAHVPVSIAVLILGGIHAVVALRY